MKFFNNSNSQMYNKQNRKISIIFSCTFFVISDKEVVSNNNNIMLEAWNKHTTAEENG